MLATNIVLALAFIAMVGIAVWLMRDESGKGSTSGGSKREQVRIVDADADEER
jgi:hypothetical protein